jgi:uncharacterized membrane protein YbhN (UPF0104 family)
VSEGPVHKRALQNLVAYAIAAGIVYYAAQRVSWSRVLDASSEATVWLFLGASVSGFLCWFIGDTIQYSSLFSSFHGPTRARDLLPTMASVYFLQLINSNVAGGAYVLFLHARRRVAWVTAGCTLMFQAYIDVMLLAILSLFALALVPSSPIRPGRDYAAGVLGAGCFIASFWLLWGQRLSGGTWLRWVYERPSMVSFRMARPSHYLKLLGIRFLICLAAGLALYGQLASFHIRVPLAQVAALTPLIVAIGNSPFSPGGIGTTQLIFTIGFAGFAGKSDLFALSLAVSGFNLLVRIPMGLAMRSPVEEAVEIKHEFSLERLKPGNALRGNPGS